MSWHVYLLRLNRGRLYVGCTSDLTRRLAEHRGGKGCRTTAKSAIVQRIHEETFPDHTAARARERQLKGWTRAKKCAPRRRSPGRPQASRHVAATVSSE